MRSRPELAPLSKSDIIMVAGSYLMVLRLDVERELAWAWAEAYAVSGSGLGPGEKAGV